MSCPACGEVVTPEDTFCESCGSPLHAGATAVMTATEPTATEPTATEPTATEPTATEPTATEPTANGSTGTGPTAIEPTTTESVATGSITPSVPCTRCGAGADEVVAGGYCGRCGLRRPAARDRQELDLGAAAAVSDRGNRHRRNEDAYAIAAQGDRFAVVVCDGVSSTPNPDDASGAVAAATVSVLEQQLDRSQWPEASDITALFSDVVAAARAALSALVITEPSEGAASPSTTLVAALVFPGRVAIANIGDSRAYWLGAAGSSRRVSLDDSVAEAAVGAGASPEEAYGAPDAHVITRWLGADGDRDPPTVTELAVEDPGVLLLCSDGLWNYFEPAAALASLVAAAAPDRGPIGIARHLVAAAIDAGGDDNVTAAVIATGPQSQEES